MHKILISSPFAILLILISINCVAQETVEFWNGNKTDARQQYELNILDAALKASSQKYGKYHINHDPIELSTNDESAVFRSKGSDVFVTVAGNPKLELEEKIIVTHPIMKGLLGYRLIIVRKQDLDKFAEIQTVQAFKQLRIGIPKGWADADLFRHNDYKVIEGGTFDQIFDLLASNEFDYIALGANEIEMAFENRAKPYGKFSIEPTTMLYYPFPLVFYVNPDNPLLAERLRHGLHLIDKNGEAQRLFENASGDIVKRLGLKGRKVFRLENPILPAEMKTFQSNLLQ